LWPGALSFAPFNHPRALAQLDQLDRGHAGGLPVGRFMAHTNTSSVPLLRTTLNGKSSGIASAARTKRLFQ
jgi:hypothetical protein